MEKAKYKTWEQYCQQRKAAGYEDRSAWRFYWAYGMNLSVQSMAERCKGAIKVAPFIKPDTKLMFRNVADVVERKGFQVHGGLWLINKAHERSLDGLEGVQADFYRKRYFPLFLQIVEQPVSCLYYQMNPRERGVMPPSEPYYNIIADGYRDFGLPLEALDDAVEEAWDNKKVTPKLRQHRKARGGTSVPRQQLPFDLQLIEGDNDNVG